MAPKIQERKSNVRIKKNDGKEGTSAASGALSSFLGIVFGKSLLRQFATFAVLVASIFGFILYRSTSRAIQNLVNADADTLKDAFFGENPYLFYCERGLGGEKVGTIPSIFSDLNVIKGNTINFATVNCSQVLPSGKTIADRFKLKKEWKPTIFGTAPWSKAVQASPTALANSQALKKFVEDALAPKATVVKSDKQLAQHCQFSKNVVYDDRDITSTCVLLVKGTKFTSTTAQLEQRLVQAYPQVKFAMVDAAKMRMTFEDPDGMPSDYFALKVHALRNGTHYQSMVHPITWDYLNTFVSSAVAAPLYDYQGESDKTVHLMKLKDLRAKKEREAKRKASQDSNKGKKKLNGDSDGQTEKPEPVRAKQSAAKGSSSTTSKPKSRPVTKASTSSTSEKQEPAKQKKEVDEDEVRDLDEEDQDDDEQEELSEASATAASQRERERLRREEMERQQREYLFESVDNDGEDLVSDEEEAEEESIIEL